MREETEINYLNFTGWLFFVTWIVSDMVPRHVLPQLERVYETLEELSRGVFCHQKLGGPFSKVIQIVLSISLAYILTTWPVWCVLRYFTYTKGMESGKYLYSITGFLCCEYALGKMARAHNYRSFFTSVFHYTIAMGAYIVFSINPSPITDVYPWLMRLMNFNF